MDLSFDRWAAAMRCGGGGGGGGGGGAVAVRLRWRCGRGAVAAMRSRCGCGSSASADTESFETAKSFRDGQKSLRLFWTGRFRRNRLQSARRADDLAGAKLPLSVIRKRCFLIANHKSKISGNDENLRFSNHARLLGRAESFGRAKLSNVEANFRFTDRCGTPFRKSQEIFDFLRRASEPPARERSEA